PIGSAPIKGRFIIDLGSGGSLVLHAPFVAGHQLLSSGLKTIRAIGTGGAGGRSNGQIGRVAELKIGGLSLKSPTTLFSQDKAGAFASTDLAGNIGQEIAGKFKLFLDYDNHRVIFEPTSAYPGTFDRATAGLALKAEDQNFRTFRITEVLENSP